MKRSHDFIQTTIKKHLPILRDKFGVSKIGLFGSYIRGEQRKNSDIDVLVEFNKPVSLFGLMDVEFYLEDLLKKKVDVVPKDALRKHIGKYILRQVQYV